ncbi:invasin domain 3-containing protein [Desulfobacterales bacterium HSG16]|nr:invasin domain 3-containing protein [Desulfobacterales bacterium HSG16]
MKKNLFSYIICFVAILLALFFMSGCGSVGGANDTSGTGTGDGGTTTTTLPPQPVYNFTGTIYGEIGSSISGVELTIFSEIVKGTTDINGQFGLNVAEELHTILASRRGYVDVYQLPDLSSGAVKEQTILMHNAKAPMTNILASSGGKVVSNQIENRVVTLDISGYNNGWFNIGEVSNLKNADISVEYIDLSDPLPLPIPAPSTLSTSDTLIGGKQAANTITVVYPGRLTMSNLGSIPTFTLNLPNPAGLVGVRILHFDPEKHTWVDTGHKTDDTPEDGTSLSIRSGGVYGIFYEVPRTGTIRGNADPGTFIFVGDDIIEVPGDGSFFAGDVPIPPDGRFKVVNINPDTGVVSSTEVEMEPGEVASVILTEQKPASSLTLTAADEYVVADGKAVTKITAEVINSENNPMPDGTPVVFSSSGGTLSATSVTTVSGLASVTLTSSEEVGMATVSASAGGVTGIATVSFIAAPESLSIVTDKIYVKSDNSDHAAITATVLDSNYSPYENITVTFTATGGQINKSRVKTDENGIAAIEFSSGTVEKRNQTVSISATVDGLPSKSVPIKVVGTVVVLTPEKTNLGEDTLTIVAKDAGEQTIYGAEIEIRSVDPANSEVDQDLLQWSLAPGYSEWKTDVTGTLVLKVKGKHVLGDAMLRVDTLGATANQAYTVSSVGEQFYIEEPDDPALLYMGTDPETGQNYRLKVAISAPSRDSVMFSTTLGFWENGNTVKANVPVVNGIAFAYLSANSTGIATVQVIDEQVQGVSDSLTVAITAPLTDAFQIALQGNASVVAPSTLELKNSIILSATVKNKNDQVVGSAPVAFSIGANSTGGEIINPPVSFTNEFGVATSTFTSGQLSSGANGVTVQAKVVGRDDIAPATFNIVIGGTAGSVVIGQSSNAESIEGGTAYKVPMMAIVSDANGNPVPKAKVSLKLWPSKYRTGYWVNCTNGSGCCLLPTGEYENEDINRNLIHDPGEDLNKDGDLTPKNSTAGTIDAFVETDDNGIATFDWIYMKEYAQWVEVEISASTTVLGTETRSTLTTWTKALAIDATTCSLSNSPYNPDEAPYLDPATIQVTAAPSSILANGTSESQIKATVKDILGNDIRESMTVVFTSTNGTLSSASANTQDGDAIVTLKSADFVGSTTITATVEEYPEIYGSVKVDFAPGSPVSATVIATPPNLSADGSSTSTITVRVRDDKDNLVSDGEIVRFNLSGTGFLSADMGTTADGVVTVTYTASTEKNTSDTITVLSSSGETLGTATVTLIDIIVKSVDMTVGLEDIIADGESHARVKAVVTDENGNVAPDGTTVTFITTAGFLNDSESTTAGTDTELNATTKNGVAQVEIFSPTNVGKATITATSGGVSSIKEINFIAGSPARIEVSASPANLTIGPDATSSIRIVVYDVKDNYVPDVRLTLDAEFGFLNNGTAITGGEGAADGEGVAVVTYTAPNYVPDEGKDIITVQAVNGISSTPVEIQLTGPQIASIELTATPETLPADGKSQATISAKLTLVGGGNAPDGTPVYFGIMQNGGGQFGDEKTTSNSVAGGIAIVTLTAGNNDRETVTIRAGTTYDEDTQEIRGIIKEIAIEYTPGSVSVIIIPNSLLGLGVNSEQEPAIITATLKNADGAKVVGGEVIFEMDDLSFGQITPINDGKSDASGEAKASFLAGTKGGTVTITATWNEVTGSEPISIQPSPNFIRVVPDYPDPVSINIKGTGGQGTSQILFAVNDSMGNAVADGYRVNFEILSGPNGGEAISPLFDYTVGGQVGTVLRSGFKSGPVSIKATYNNNSNVTTTTSQIAIEAGPPVGEEFGIRSQFLNIAGLNTAGIQNSVSIDGGDRYGNSIPDNTAISFKTYNTGGLFVPGSSTTTNGIAETKLESAARPVPMQGMTSITAEAVNGGRTTHVTCLEIVKDTEHNSIIYAGTDGGGVYLSMDSGATWKNISRSSQHAGQNWIDPYVNDISVDPDNSNTIYAATGYLGKGNVYQSLDGGLNWNSNDPERWAGVFQSDAAVVSVLADDDGCDNEDCNSTTYEIEYRDLTELPCFEVKTPDEPPNPPYEVYPGNEDNDNDGKPDCTGNVRTFTVRSTQHVWVGTRGEGLYYASNGKDFKPAEKGLGQGTYVEDIVKVKSSQNPVSKGPKAILYAGTSNGVFKSTDGGATWKNPSSFAGDSINTLVLHPFADGEENDILYAGTEQAGVWVSTRSGSNWTQYASGMGKGLSASTPVVSFNNKGNGVMSKVAVSPDCISENWTLTYVTEIDDVTGDVIDKYFKVSGSESGVQTKNCYTDTDMPYESDKGEISFTVSSGGQAFEAGDMFTFSTTRDDGRTIKDIAIDASNKLLYAVTYFDGPSEVHAVGNVYVHDLNADGSMKPGDWREASLELPMFDPPDDKTLFAQHVLAVDTDNYGKTKTLYVGGEGINFYKATAGLTAGEPQWRASKNGLSNFIMARAVVLFSGPITEMKETHRVMSEYYAEYGCADNRTQFIVYLQDDNGNPPIAGSDFTGLDGSTLVYQLTFSDVLALSFKGTFRDLLDPRTDNPIVFYYTPLVGVSLTFTPKCDEGGAAPGCSGNILSTTLD